MLAHEIFDKLVFLLKRSGVTPAERSTVGGTATIDGGEILVTLEAFGVAQWRWRCGHLQLALVHNLAEPHAEFTRHQNLSHLLVSDLLRI